MPPEAKPKAVLLPRLNVFLAAGGDSVSPGQMVRAKHQAATQVARIRFHVNGAQYIDERVTTFDDSSSEFTYYLVNQNFSIAGTGNADGLVIERLDYSSTGDFAGGGPGASSFYHDADDDLDLDLRDFANFQNCFDPSGSQAPQACLDVHDFDTSDAPDGDIDLDDYARLFDCSRGPFVTPDQGCGLPGRSGAPPPSGTFTLHGRVFRATDNLHSSEISTKCAVCALLLQEGTE